MEQLAHYFGGSQSKPPMHLMMLGMAKIVVTVVILVNLPFPSRDIQLLSNLNPRAAKATSRIWSNVASVILHVPRGVRQGTAPPWDSDFR
jgi:hypothetical protein